MNKIFEVVGEIRFNNVFIDVYDDIDDPLFCVADIGKMIGYDASSTNKLIAYCEEDEHLTGRIFRSGQVRTMKLVTERGLYNILAQSRMPSARKWRRVISDELIKLRKEANRNISDQFDIWSDTASNIYFDECTGELMESYILPGGDVGQRQYKA